MNDSDATGPGASPVPDDGRHDELSEIEAEVRAQSPAFEIGPDGTAGLPVEGDTSPGPPPNPLQGRQRFLVLYLRVALIVVFALGLVELVIPEEARRTAGLVMVGCLIVAPLGRVLWLVVRWFTKRDWRFAATGLVLLAVVSMGLLAR